MTVQPPTRTVSTLRGEEHVKGSDDCCMLDSDPCPKCGARVHTIREGYQPDLLICEACPEDAWVWWPDNIARVGASS